MAGINCDCPVCGASEVNEETGLLNVRGLKVEHSGLWWSECLRCKEKHGDGWWAYEDDHVVLSVPLAMSVIAEGGEVDLIE
jgi:hypothetical protein